MNSDMKQLGFQFHDGGRMKAGYTGFAGDCVCRSIAIASGSPYQDVYDELSLLQKKFLATRRSKKWNYNNTTARNGIYKEVYKKYILEKLNGVWVPTMKIGSGCKVHLRADELPLGTLIVRVSKHLTTVIDHVIYDTLNPSRKGTRCVYGYFKL